MSRLEALKERFGGKRIGVLMGGMSGEREVSLRSGTNVVAALRRQGIGCLPIDPRDEHWTAKLDGIDAAFLALHGRDGEDGRMQGFLDTMEIPYTGSGVLASAVGMNKVVTKTLLLANGLPTAPYVLISNREDLRAQVDDVGDRLGFPLVVKPTSEGSSLGVSIVRNPDDLLPVLKKTFYDYKAIFAEKYIKGMEITVGLVGVDQRLRALPVLELVPKNEFYDYEAKYTHGMTQFFIPARLTDDLTTRVQEIAVKAHLAVGCHGFSRVDMMVSTDGEPFITEINTLPGLTDLSDLPAQAKAAGVSYDELILEILESAFIERLGE
ncbi:MAG: D-alanine--D-alanine ligase [Candidatus Poribacteria bacterium]|nr:D-alanine--D-alanine ligase [Candidatus Poribacteria bacterium]